MTTTTPNPCTLSARPFRVAALEASIANRIRRTGLDCFGDAVEVRRDIDRHQCRVCLHLTKPQEKYLLLSYSPFEQRTPYSERGPIFIHQRDCAPYENSGELPSGFPRNIVLRAYDQEGAIVKAELAQGDDLETLVLHLLDHPGVSYIHARNRTYGCYMYRIETA